LRILTVLDANGRGAGTSRVQTVAGEASCAARGITASWGASGDIPAIDAAVVALSGDVGAGQGSGAGSRPLVGAHRRAAVAAGGVAVVALLGAFASAIAADRSGESAVLDANGRGARASGVEAVAGETSCAAGSLTAGWGVCGNIAAIDTASVPLTGDVGAGQGSGACRRHFARTGRGATVAAGGVAIIALLNTLASAIATDTSGESTVLDANGRGARASGVEAVAGEPSGAAGSLTAGWGVCGNIAAIDTTPIALSGDVGASEVSWATRSRSLVRAVGRAAVAAGGVAIVALLGAFTGTVAADRGRGREGAVVLAAVARDGVAVVALFGALDGAVAADRVGGSVAAVILATIGRDGVAIVALLGAFDGAVATDRRGGGAHAVVFAAVARDGVAIVALLGALARAVATHRRGGGVHAVAFAAVARDGVAVVALLGALARAVATHRGRAGDGAVVLTAVTRGEVAVVACFTRVERAVAARTRERAVCGAVDHVLAGLARAIAVARVRDLVGGLIGTRKGVVRCAHASVVAGGECESKKGA